MVRVVWPVDATGRLTAQDTTTDLWCLLGFTAEGALAQPRTSLACADSAAQLIVSWGEGAWKLPLYSHSAPCNGGRGLHRANITAVLYYKPTATIITADTIGIIKNFTPVSHLPGRIKSLDVVSVTSEYLNGHFGLDLGNSGDVATILAVCEGHPNSVHMCLAFAGTPFCCAVTKQAILRAMWEWTSDRLFVLHQVN
ncbi:unnamed protein product [Schistocephalus solidus]|uniref:Mediator of RNA polymerase II transcription subunit 16 n=1 Tax=Schistocephalus solidus TaxID=70667 RepID=A0A183SQS3_SCHSO|nr:unnamed protein product [Schistocephalus solidus]